jgi:hypothetical protein
VGKPVFGGVAILRDACDCPVCTGTVSCRYIAVSRKNFPNRINEKGGAHRFQIEAGMLSPARCWIAASTERLTGSFGRHKIGITVESTESTELRGMKRKDCSVAWLFKFLQWLIDVRVCVVTLKARWKGGVLDWRRLEDFKTVTSHDKHGFWFGIVVWQSQ